MMDGAKLLGLIGLPYTHKDVRASLMHLMITRVPEVHYLDEDDEDTLQTQDFVVNKRLGLDFGFEDEASFRGGHLDDIGQGPMLLTQMYFYCEHPEVSPFPGQLPYGLEASDDRDTVRAKMAEWEPSRRSYIRDCWDVKGHRMTASYVDDGARLGFLFFSQPPPSVPADLDDAGILPSAGSILLSLGLPMSDRELQMALRPLRFEPMLEEAADGLMADFSDRFGLELYFSHAGGRADLSLTQVIFNREDAYNNPRWPGQLPHLISFDDTPGDVFEKLGPPETMNDRDFSGVALWRFPKHACVVEYNTMDNTVLSVEIAASGVRE